MQISYALRFTIFRSPLYNMWQKFSIKENQIKLELEVVYHFLKP